MVQGRSGVVSGGGKRAPKVEGNRQAPNIPCRILVPTKRKVFNLVSLLYNYFLPLHHIKSNKKNMENQIQLAVKAFHEANKPIIAQLAREFDVPYHRLRARIHGRQSHADRGKATRSLNLIQEKALTSYIQTLNNAQASPTPEMIETAANTILKRAGEDRVVGHNWVYRFIARLPPSLNYINQKPKEKSRVDSDPEVILNPPRQRDLDLAAEGSPLRISTPSPSPDFASSATNSPPDTIGRVKKLNTKLLEDLEEIENLPESVQRHIQRSMDANTLLSQELESLNASLMKSQSHKSAANAPKNMKSLLGTKGNVPSPIRANRMMAKRQDVEAKKLKRL